MRNSKKVQLQFIKEVNEFFKNLGFVPVDASESYEMKIKTKIGFLYIRVDDDNSNMFTVFANFLEFRAKAKERFDHWKNNIHTMSELNEAIKEIKNYYTNILKIANA